MKSGSSASTPYKNSDVDFHDVFGGPPRRSSTQEMRYSFNDVAVTKAPKGDDDDDDDSLSGKPVFGEDSLNRRRRRTHSDDFFDDIFKGNSNSVSSSPRRLQRDPYSSSPSSRLPKPESSLPTPFRFSHYFFCYRKQIVSSLFSFHTFLNAGLLIRRYNLGGYAFSISLHSTHYVIMCV